MTADFAYDPVTAIDEAQATGETVVLLAEIRQTMRIPLVTSIWRGLAGMDDSLRLAWAAAKPIYESGVDNGGDGVRLVEGRNDEAQRLHRIPQFWQGAGGASDRRLVRKSR